MEWSLLEGKAPLRGRFSASAKMARDFLRHATSLAVLEMSLDMPGAATSAAERVWKQAQ